MRFPLLPPGVAPRRALAVVLLASLISGTVSAFGAVEFNRDIRPILSDKCFRCHGLDRTARKAGLRLDGFEEATALRKEGAAIVPSQPAQSRLVQRIQNPDPHEVMPPPETGKSLTSEEKTLLERWIEEGARYEAHWAYLPLPPSPSPGLAKGTARGPAPTEHPVDRFVRSRAETAGIEPSPEADRRTLIRRLALDLHGVPPRPEQVERFVKSRDSRAYEKLVEDFLASPRYAERMTVQWLDLVRYADSIGYHGDCPISLWPYRDYVLRAFQENLPFDQFTREQLAGDLLPGATERQKIASGYNRLLRISNEGGAQDKEYLAKYAADRVRTTSAVWLGSTLGCAECHDHKFDPFTTRDFYRFEAFFSDLKEKGFYGNGFASGDWGPRLSLATREQELQLERLNQQMQRATNQLESAVTNTTRFELARTRWEESIKVLDHEKRLEWLVQTPVSASTRNGASLSIGTNGWMTAEGTNPDSETYEVTFRPGIGRFTAFRIETGSDESFPGNRIGRGGISFVLTEVDLAVRDARGARGDRPLRIAHLVANQDGDGFPALAAMDHNPSTGWAITSGQSIECQLVLHLAQPFSADASTVLILRLHHDSPQRRCTIAKFRVSGTDRENPLPDRFTLPEETLKAIRKPAAERSEAERAAINATYRKMAPEGIPFARQMAKLKAQRSQLAASIPSTLISLPITPRTTRVLPRGNWMDESGEVVDPGIPAFLGVLDTGNRRATRLDLANWLTGSENPLTSRAFVNRLWKQFFGTGLSKTLDDLGSQGEWPTHPELLDWLAAEFRQPNHRMPEEVGRQEPHPWDVKHAIRLIVTSATYRQRSVSRPELDERDPFNRLLARQSRFRIEAEFVRDNALAISGLLSGKFGGPSVRPYQPDGYWASLNFPKREYVTDRSENLYRRGLYTHWQRTFLHPSLLAFDAPGREECTVNRINSNTPLQALVLLNDPNFTEAARVFAEKTLRHGGRNLDARLRWAWLRALGRPPEASELAVLRELHTRQQQEFSQDPAAAAQLIEAGTARVPRDLPAVDLAAMTSVTRALLNLHETITRN